MLFSELFKIVVNKVTLVGFMGNDLPLWIPPWTCAILSRAGAKSARNEWRRKLMRSTWLGLAFIRFRYLTDFQETNKSSSCFVTISNNIEVKYCHLADR